MAKIISVSEAVDLIHNGMTVGISGFGAYASPDSILEGIGKKFREQNSPRDLTIVSGVAPGDFDDNGCGMSKIADDGIVDTLIASHLRMSPPVGRAVSENKIAAYSMPLGVYGQLMAAIGGKRPGILTHVGLHTYADPVTRDAASTSAPRSRDVRSSSWFRWMARTTCCTSPFTSTPASSTPATPMSAAISPCRTRPSAVNCWSWLLPSITMAESSSSRSRTL